MGATVQFDGDIIPNMDFDPNVTVVKPLNVYNDCEYGHRSAMVEDRFIIGGAIYEVVDFGFKQVEVA
jgi:hypothetical protein